ncbi:putative dienelactone hydrolase family protein [Neofusicoccum parvum UCRNP2]|uniref:Putative dienelactone hydrolase family protein n=1 Tax=Botryosphaeria parva (strain UCR-NP2) TaxID=1287680 RepID=R1GVS2_BOTPV|nr:putative dienelactone hydrolase family protein [Neofusicoccum parvum UCRNP2]
MASYPPGNCCTVGIKHEGTPVGKIEKIAGYNTYVSYPPDKSTENTVFIVSDIFGYQLINAQLIADQFAANGYFVVIPDLFDDGALPIDLPKGFDVMKWLDDYPPTRIDPIVQAVIKELRSNKGVKRIGAAGYCLGAKYVCRHLKTGLFDAGYIAHPSLVEPEEVRAIQGPLSIAAAETDAIFPTPKRRESEDILVDIKATYQINVYSGVTHGYAIRDDISKKHVKFAMEQAFLQAVHWFDEYVKA